MRENIRKHSFVGCTLSGGQRQRLSLARCLLRAPKILLLDEVTASLDPLNQSRALQGIGSLCDESPCTVLVIAHRLKTLEQVDRILVLHHGRIVEDGSHQTLVAKNGMYGRLILPSFTAE